MGVLLHNRLLHQLLTHPLTKYLFGDPPLILLLTWRIADHHGRDRGSTIHLLAGPALETVIAHMLRDLYWLVILRLVCHLLHVAVFQSADGRVLRLAICSRVRRVVPVDDARSRG